MNQQNVEPRVSDKIRMLGWANRMTATPSADEFRADFTVRVPAGVEPIQVEYTWAYADPNSWMSLVEVDDIQNHVDQNYSIVHTRHDGDEDILYISARGDAVMPAVATSVTYTAYVRVTLPTNEALAQKFTVENVGRQPTSGRPAVLPSWDYVNRDKPGYVGPNAQAGWGNIVGDSGRSIPGGKFYLDALNSGRSIATGCDITDDLIYQWVDQDGNRVGEPQHLEIKNHSGGFTGAFLHKAQSFENPGYYRLMVWPQAESSSPSAPSDCTGVSYNPNDLAQGTQAGSVFWKLPATTIVNVSVTTPVEGSTVGTATPIFTGTGEPGANIEIKDATGTALGATVVGADGEWSVTSTELANGPVAATVTQTAGSSTSTATVNFTVEHEITPVALTSPAIGAIFTRNSLPFTGTGQPGATIEVIDDHGNHIVTATVDPNGEWSGTASALPYGHNSGEVVQHTDGETTSTVFDFHIAAPLVVTVPAEGSTVSGVRPTFAGTATPGSTINIIGSVSGSLLASAIADANGHWNATATINHQVGHHVNYAEQYINDTKVDSVSFGFTVITSTPPEPSYPTWNPNGAYRKGDIVAYQGHRYRAVQDHVGNGDPNRINAPSLWKKID
ncbi:Ig-like domain-containing protein [Nocardia sp. 2YAB30]|uniref:Ig-like domain-containing protein n=1 Tax=Nocardia sp. 2YAB30 TaxID=3233022 RepID=UPI003F952E8E